MSRFVVTGTDTGIGKTVFSAALTQALGATYWKPVQAGIEDETDSAAVARLSGCPVLPEAHRLLNPLSPHRAAELEGITIDTARLIPPAVPGPLVIEGAGGALVPVTRDTLYADLFARWQIPVILCARTGLGTINHSLAMIEVLRARNVPIHGIAFIGDANEDNEATIAAIGGVRRLGRLPHLDPLTGDKLASAFAAGFDRSTFA
ncbi:dethiobiotin synthase [Sphingomonas laterariae]|uniref:ATP-dependent dethiobiotin synthetase BioD n=1 Tax=Edaphosphingomonas laterariae TaxID=861865 RepID=A0A239C6A7_9SPHN|nr:dethiobiotin synthase [Sphingomonas laterariae]SNS15459.1 dethiobiotin synthase [Sphingomonas laterariae]